IELDVGALEPAHELGVADAVHTRRGVDADDPQRAKVPLALATVPGGEAPRVMHRIDHRLPELAAPAAITLGVLTDPVAATARLEATFCSSHFSLPHRPANGTAIERIYTLGQVGRAF